MVGPGQKGILCPAEEGLSKSKGKVMSACLLPERTVHAGALGSSPASAIRGGMRPLAPDLLTRVIHIGEFVTNLVPGDSATRSLFLYVTLPDDCIMQELANPASKTDHVF